jgi:hypothetical protein
MVNLSILIFVPDKRKVMKNENMVISPKPNERINA